MSNRILLQPWPADHWGGIILVEGTVARDQSTKFFGIRLWHYLHDQLFPHDMAVCQNLVPLVNIKIAGKWMFIPLKMVLIGIDPYPYPIKSHHYSSFFIHVPRNL
jgi:hypothetical protein